VNTSFGTEAVTQFHQVLLAQTKVVYKEGQEMPVWLVGDTIDLLAKELEIIRDPRLWMSRKIWIDRVSLMLKERAVFGGKAQMRGQRLFQKSGNRPFRPKRMPFYHGHPRLLDVAAWRVCNPTLTGLPAPPISQIALSSHWQGKAASQAWDPTPIGLLALVNFPIVQSTDL